MLDLPNANEILYFIELANAQNMSRAAERLGIRQPTLSVAISKLEHNLSIRLFLRTKKGVSLTEAGQLFLSKAQELLNSWNEIKTQTQTQSQTISGQIRLGCHVSVALYTLPFFMPKMMSEFPGLEFLLEHDFSRKISEAVISLRLDMGIVVNPVKHPDLVIKKLCYDDVAFWKSDRPGQEKVLIADHQLIQTQALMQKSKKGGFERFITTSSLEVARELAEAGAGAAILPSRVVNANRKSNLKRITGLPTFRDEVCLVFRAERRTNRTLQVLAERIAEVFDS